MLDLYSIKLKAACFKQSWTTFEF